MGAEASGTGPLLKLTRCSLSPRRQYSVRRFRDGCVGIPRRGESNLRQGPGMKLGIPRLIHEIRHRSAALPKTRVWLRQPPMRK